MENAKNRSKFIKNQLVTFLGQIPFFDSFFSRNLGNPFLWLAFIFQIWMLVHALRNGEWIWAVCIFFFSLISALLYFFMVYRNSHTATRGFELPGADQRQRIRELEGKIHHLDKAHHHSQLGDIYFQQGKLDKAEACYRAAMERDPSDHDTVSHLGQCLLRKKQHDEARILLEKVVAEVPGHDYGHTMMALAELLQARGDQAEAVAAWQKVLEKHSYARARVQLASLYLDQGKAEEARALLQEVLSDDKHAPAFQRSREKIWVRKARSLLGRK